MVQDERILNAMREMCNSKLPHTDEQRVWHIANIPALLREARYDELDARFNQALTDSFTSREAEKRYFLAWTQMCNRFYDMDALVDAGPQGLALIKAWQHARPRSTHAWLAEAQYWNHRAWLYRSYGWAEETSAAMWVCAGACKRANGHCRIECYRLRATPVDGCLINQHQHKSLRSTRLVN